MSAIKPVLKPNCRNAAIHWSSKAKASAVGMLKAIDIKLTINATINVCIALAPLKLSVGVFLSHPPKIKSKAPMKVHTKAMIVTVGTATGAGSWATTTTTGIPVVNARVSAKSSVNARTFLDILVSFTSFYEGHKYVRRNWCCWKPKSE